MGMDRALLGLLPTKLRASCHDEVPRRTELDL